MSSHLDLNFESLTELHDSVNALLHSQDTNLELINPEHEKFAQEVSEASLKLADSCSAAIDLLHLAIDHLQNLQSAFRRITTTTNNDNNTFAPHRLPRKQLKKAILKRLDSIKAMKNSAAFSDDHTDDPRLMVVVNLLKEVRSTTLSIVRSLMSLIAIPNPDRKMDTGRKDAIFRIRLTRVDSLGFWEKRGGCDVRAAMKRLEEVEAVVEDMEAELERMFRRLIRTRASLLNILSS